MMPLGILKIVSLFSFKSSTCIWYLEPLFLGSDASVHRYLKAQVLLSLGVLTCKMVLTTVPTSQGVVRIE